jgi:L-alanine-DL-glutamate epimerase-like enolase superfamily enzyme
VPVSVERRMLRFSRPIRTSYGSTPDRELLLLSVTEDGLCGRGEAAPLEPYDGVSVGDVRTALDAHRGVIEDSAGQPRGERLAACQAVSDLPQALAAVDVALCELEALRAGRPLAAWLCDAPLEAVAVSAMVDAEDPAAAADRAADAARQGFGCLKVKVGTGGDLERVRAVRAAAGPQVGLVLDANGAWSVDQAAQALGELAAAQPELVEEPVSGLAALKELRPRTPLALAIDETAADPDALAAGVADAVCLKLSRCGGVSGLLEAAAVARAAGSRVYLGSTYDGPIGIAATLHAAAALHPDHPCGLATLSLFADLGDLAPAALQLAVRAGQITVPRGPGLGV